MKDAQIIPRVHKVITSHPSVISVATAATGFMRQMATKPFTPRNRSREFKLLGSLPSIHAVRNQVYEEKGTGDTPYFSLH